MKLGWRMLWKHPLLTAVSVVSLAVGIPAGFAPSYGFDAVEAPLPVEEGERVVGLRHLDVESPGSSPTTVDDLAVWRESLTTFEALGAYRHVQHNLIVGEDGQDRQDRVGAAVAGAVVTASTFSILGVPPLLGRALMAEDEAPGGARVVVVGEDVWRSRLAGDPDVVGRTVRVGGVPHTVVGVMPASFLFPVHEELWLPLRDRPTGEPGVGAPLRAEVLSFPVMATGGPKGGMSADPDNWLGIVVGLLILGVACANVGLLIFARTATRASELAVRTAPGASRARIVGQVFVEALVLAVIAAGVGLLLLAWLPPRVMGWLWSEASVGGGMPWWFDFSVRPPTVAKALALAVVSAAVAAALPALRLTGRAASRNLQRSGAGGWSVRFGAVSSGLVVADVAVAVAVVGVCLGVADRMADLAPGSELEGIPASEYLAVRIELPEDPRARPDSAAHARRVAALHGAMVERLAAEPGVLGVATAEVLPRVFAFVLLALAGSGIFAIMSFTVAQRTREIGIRGALGARRGDIAATVGRRAALQLGLGALLGMPVAGWLYFIIRMDPAATVNAFLAGVVPGVAIMLGVGLAACSVPIVRALRITPTEAMRGAD